MKPEWKQTGASRAIRLMIALYLGLFISWFAPHHIQAHCAGDIGVSASVEVASQILAHHPELCQLCHAHGQVDLVLAEHITISQPDSASPISQSPYHVASLLPAESLSPRSPPSVA